jgi:hypothetical protein
MRTLLAFLVAPLLPAVMLAGLSVVNDSHPPLAVLILFTGACYALQVVVGVPAFLILGRARRRNIRAYALLGFGGLALPFLLYSLYRDAAGNGLGQLLYATCQIGLFGAGTGSVFWLIARPDRVAQAAQPGSN